jgi:transcriptional regulator with PAS, ATPase and Fis domain
MSDTDTKPEFALSHTPLGQAIRVVFVGGRVLVPPAIVLVSGDLLRVGREVQQGLRLNDAHVSRHHASFHVDTARRLVVADNRSKNGTFINGERCETRALSLGDVVSLGDSCLVVGEEPTGSDEAQSYGIEGGSAAMRRARASVRALGPLPLSVLLIAETGCGKEVVARALHAASGLNGPFVAVNCAAIPEGLFESQFFGHTAKAFTGAIAHEGFFRAAIGGTLFLDEIGELPMTLQPKLLRVLQERAVVPLGSVKPVPCPVRIVAATNRDLQGAVETGKFRADLLARLDEARIALPPLRERREDILEPFSKHLTRTWAIPHELAEGLLLHDWPFNWREAVAWARKLELASTGHRLDAKSFAPESLTPRPELDGRPTPTSVRARSGNAVPSQDHASPISAAELTRLLTETGGTVAEVARAVGRSRRQVYRWIAKYQLQIENFRS